MNVNRTDAQAKEPLFDKVLAPFPDGIPNIHLRLSRLWLTGSGAAERARQELERFIVTED